MPQAQASNLSQTATSPLAGRSVLQIVPSLQAGAAEHLTLEIASALAAAGARPLVAASGGQLVSELQARGGIWIPFPALTTNPLGMVRNVRTLVEVIRRERPAVVHAQSRGVGWVALGATRLTGTPFMTTYHGGYAGRHAIQLHYNSVMARGDAVLANSYFTSAAILRLYPWARDRVRVIWPGIDLRVFYPGAVAIGRVEAIRQAWDIEPDQRIVLLASRLVDGGGHAVLIEAASRLKVRGVSDVVVVLAGEGDGRPGYPAELDALAKARSVSGVVRRVGRCDDMPAALVAASVIVAPATNAQGFSLGAMEAQAMGKPVIVANLGAMPEIVLTPPDVAPEQRTGWIVAAGNAEVLADAIEAVLNLGASALDTLAVQARAHAEQQFGSDRMTEAVLDAYGALLEERWAAAGSRVG